ncbi:sulfatase [Lentisphaera profundi]|uniref:Sulfatase n=1 Tax=Lentisphaera profundi TaxID=1658616 RepID=A0ABY7VUR7_9BACT|nr:sulfatase [Lentisphaera profundi]WDE96955.1 sulfatase [Lentisphaera profundi]
MNKFRQILFYALFLTLVISAQKKPNIVLIYADDQGWKDIGYQSDGEFKTPVLDKLASEGMIFTDAYTNAANCQPARACLLSGNYTPRHHVFAVNSTNRGPSSKMRLIPIPNRDGLAVENITIADALKEAGYATGHFGKWHLYEKGGKNTPGGGGALPSQQGFDVTYDSFGEGEHPEGAKGNLKGPSNDAKGVYTLSRKACEFMEANKDKPFFVYLAHHAPHGPVQARESTRKMISDTYKACIYDLDDSVGHVLKKIKELGLEKDTLVIYTSDNGSGAKSQEPLRGKKGCYYEGGIREPMIAYWPGVIEAGSVSSVPVMQIDYFPTFLDMAGVKSSKILDGESLMPLLTQTGKLKRQSLFWHMPGYLDKAVLRGRDKIFRTRPVTVMRKGRWKMHLYLEEWLLDGGRAGFPDNKAIELYDLEHDRGEYKNIATEKPELVDQLLTELLEWHGTCEAPIPTEKNPAYGIEEPSKGKKSKNKRKNKKESK